jgi:hypothetical protein
MQFLRRFQNALFLLMSPSGHQIDRKGSRHGVANGGRLPLREWRSEDGNLFSTRPLLVEHAFRGAS